MIYSPMLQIMSNYALRYPLAMLLANGQRISLEFSFMCDLSCFNLSRREMIELDEWLSPSDALRTSLVELELDGIDAAILNRQCSEHVLALHGMCLASLPG